MGNETVTQIYIASAAGAPVGVLDVGQTLSRMNHRMYRQGRNYCQRITLDPTSATSYNIFALRDDWMVHNSWKKAYQTFLNNHKEEMQQLSNGQARWFDFRINDAIATGAEMQPVRYDINTLGVVTGNKVSYGEFQYSDLFAEDGTSRALNIQITSLGVSYGILHEYEKMGSISPDPASSESIAAYENIDDDLKSAAVQQLTDEGNSPPYSGTSVNYGSPFVKVGQIGTGAGGVQRLSTGYFNAPCGIIVIVPTAGDISPTAIELCLEMKPGKYKGVHGPTMGTAKLVAGTYEVK